MEIMDDLQKLNPEENVNGNREEKKAFLKVLRYFLLAILIVIIPTFLYFSIPPKDFPSGEIIKIENGMTLKQAAQLLEDESVIRSAQFMQILAMIRNRNFTIISGSYLFDFPVSVFQILSRVNKGVYGDVYDRVTIPEGSSNKQIAEILNDSNLVSFDKEKFVQVAYGKEGYLFPDTYFLLPEITEEEIVEQMADNFDSQVRDLQAEILLSEYTMEELIIMASIVEKEANINSGEEDEAPIIAGILWSRIEKGIPLQVDAPFLYILGKASSQLTLSDLKIDSPFNTYRYKGLPPAPIGNPGLDAIIASLRPIDTDYLFYLHDNDGGVHYAKTLSGHNSNKAKYLK